MAMPAGYKPSPLRYGSPRSSPFRRPESPSSPSPLRQSTPTATPTKIGPGVSAVSARFETPTTPTSTTEAWGGKGQRLSMSDDTLSSPLKPAATITSRPSAIGHGNALSRLQPAQTRTLREGFQILDRDSDGSVNRDDVADMLSQLGQPANASDVSKFFPPSASQAVTLPVFLNSLAATLVSLSDSAELLSAFSAFDDDDNGQVDLVELRDALVHTVPEPGERALTAAEVDKVMNGFTGRKAFTRSKPGGLGKRGEVFKYQDFVQSILGGSTGSGSDAASEDTDES